MSGEIEEGEEDMDQEFMPGFESSESFSTEALKRTVQSVRAFHSLPSVGPEWEALKTSPIFNRSMKKNRLKILNIVSSILQHSKISSNEFKRRDADEKFDFLIEANDDILERIGSSLDEASGLFKKAEALVINPKLSAMRPPGTWNKRKAGKAPSAPTTQPMEETIEQNVEMTNLTSESTTSENIKLRDMKKAQYRLKQSEKPQLRFNPKIDNSLSPFIPKLKEKPNSIKPLSILPEYNLRNEEFYGHPYQFELDRWNPPDSHLTKTTLELPSDINDTSFIFIQTRLELEEMIAELRPVEEIAVDLEHHSLRSFLGFTCLLQLSSRSKDYIVDGLELREDLHLLNEIFTNPKIIKVFHGSSSDIEWLQKDFGLYIVGLFDSYLAGRALGFNQLSLAFLLKHYCGVTSNKKYQRADWRIRPIPEAMLSYAQMDTHYLLYIYDCLKNELITAGNDTTNVLCSVFSESRLLCLKRFEKPTNNPTLALRKIKRALNNRQQSAYTEIFKWRDALAREKDESLGFILPNHMLIQIAITLPKELSGVLACCHPVPFFVQTNLGHIHRIVQKARSLPFHEEKLSNDVKSDKPKKERAWVVMMNSIHDVTPEDLGFDIKLDDEENVPELKTKPKLNVCTQWPQSYKEVPDWEEIKLSTGRNFKFNSHPTKSSNSNETNSAINPYDRYKLSNQILGLLRDPEKGKELDMNDPLVKTVYETIFKVDEEKDNKDVLEIPTTSARVANSEMEQEFIPFNPMAEKRGGAVNKRKGKRKHEEWVESFANPGPNEDHLEISSDDDDAIVDYNETSKKKKTPKFLPVSNEQTNKKKKKNKHLEKLKRLGRKTKVKKEDVEDGEVVDDEEEDEVPQNDSSMSKGPPNKRFRPDSKDHKDKRGKGGKSGKKKGKNSKGKTGFFNFRSRDGKSMTFK